MAGNKEFYKGKRKKRNYYILAFALLLALIAVVVVLFYGMQKYAVITKDGVSVELPILSDGSTVIDDEGNEVRVFDHIDVDVVFEAPDYSEVETLSGKHRIWPLRAIFVPSDDLGRDSLMAYMGRLNTGNALVLEMKPVSGMLMFNSDTPLAVNYGLSANNGMVDSLPATIKEMRETAAILNKDLYLVAQINCCIDDLLASRNGEMGLYYSNGAPYRDDRGTWVDPYSLGVRNYIIALVRELYDMGFDEVVLANLIHPVLEEGVTLSYSREMSTPTSPLNAVCGFALSVAQALDDRDGLLSIYCDSYTALMGTDEATGQSARTFFRLFDRVYYPTDRYAYGLQVESVNSVLNDGELYDRFVPVVQNYLPDNPDQISWVLVDVDTDE